MNQSEVISFLCEKMRAGGMTAAQANVEKVRMLRVELVTNRLTADVRKALNEAVKTGHLAHMKKDGLRPEVYYHPNFDYLANGARAKHVADHIEALRAVSGKVFA